MLLSFVFGVALTVRATFNEFSGPGGDPERLFWSTTEDEEDGVTGIGETSGSKDGQVVMKICDLMACPIQVTQFNSDHEAVGTRGITPNVTLEINWNANFFSCRITSIRVSGVLKNPPELCYNNWDYTIEPFTINDGDQFPNDQEFMYGGRDGYWSLVHHNFNHELYCKVEYGLFMERKNLHSCEAFKAKLMLGGKETQTNANYDYEKQTIFQFTFGPWFAATFPEIANGYVDWGSHGSGKNRSVLDSISANKMNVMVGVAGVGFIAAVGVLAFKKKNEYASLEQEPLHV